MYKSAFDYQDRHDQYKPLKGPVMDIEKDSEGSCTLRKMAELLIKAIEDMAASMVTDGTMTPLQKRAIMVVCQVLRTILIKRKKIKESQIEGLMRTIIREEI